MGPERNKEFEPRPIQPGIEVICGPMFSGKSGELITELRRTPHAGYKVQAFYPNIDNRRKPGTINTEDGAEYPATAVDSSENLLSLVDTDTDIVGIDEANFFDDALTEVCIALANKGKRVIVAGLDKNFRGEAFGPMKELKFEADCVRSVFAYCKKCGSEASRTQRIINGSPANYDDPVVLVGAEEYEARCRSCHEVPGKPDNILNES